MTEHSTHAESTVIAMHGEEAARAAAFGRVTVILSSFGLILQRWYGGDFHMSTAASIALAVLGSTGAWVWYRARDPKRYSRVVFRLFGAVSALCALVLVHHLGAFSPVAAAIVLGLAFFGSADDGPLILGIGLFVSATYFVSALLITLGVLPELGVFAAPTPAPARYAMLIMVTAIMVAQLWQSRMSRRATMEAIERAHQSARVAAAREAQLHEAHEHLDAVIRAGAGRQGRWSGATLGKYVLEDVVGRGAMGEVYAAHVTDGAARAAVKLLNVARSDDPEIARRFLREAEIAVRVRGPNLVDVRDVGAAPDGSAYIAMELLEGSDLATILRDENVLALDDARALVHDVAAGLEALHDAGVVHRDLKPQNLFRANGPPAVWKILDYGVSKLHDGSVTLTEGNLVGTPGYMSPEQAQGKSVDARSDVFALGAVAYRVLTGRRPFVGSDTPQLLYQVVYNAPIRPRELAPDLPRDVELVLAVALAKKAEDRFATAAELAAAFAAASGGDLDAKLRERAERIVRSLPWAKDPVNAMGRTAVGVPAPRLRAD